MRATDAACKKAEFHGNARGRALFRKLLIKREENSIFDPTRRRNLFLFLFFGDQYFQNLKFKVKAFFSSFFSSAFSESNFKNNILCGGNPRHSQGFRAGFYHPIDRLIVLLAEVISNEVVLLN